MDPGIGCENKYFINISEECYHHWKIVKEEMGFKEDEDLLYYLMNLKRRTLSVALEYVVVSNLSKDLCCFLMYGKSVLYTQCNHFTGHYQTRKEMEMPLRLLIMPKSTPKQPLGIILI